MCKSPIIVTCISAIKLGVDIEQNYTKLIILAAISDSLLVLGPCEQQFHERGGVLNALLRKLCDLRPNQS